MFSFIPVVAMFDVFMNNKFLQLKWNLMMLKNLMLTTTFLMSTLSLAHADPLIAGYLDATATGSALKVNMNQAHQDGYNMVIFGFAKISGANIDFYDASSQTVIQQKLTDAKNNGMKVLISVGGQANTFNPGSLDSAQLSQLATNIVNFIKTNHLDGIDFDIEVKTDPNLILTLLQDIRNIDANVLLTAAPQINNGQLVSTGNNQDYQSAINAGLFNYLFLQEYNTPPQNDISYISSIYPTIKAQVPSQTKIVTGQPTAGVAAGTTSIYHPTPEQTLNTQEVTPKMLPELLKINGDSQYGGVMGWSLNVDYDAGDYGDATHIAGTYAYGLKDCVLNNQCVTPPTPKPSVSNYTLQTSDTDTATGLGIIMTIKDNQGNTFTTDYIAPNSNKVYNAYSNPSAVTIEGKQNLTVHWVTYQGGPSGDCPGSFNLTQNMNIMVNPTYKSCDFKALP
jgi:chitinase